MMCHHPIIPLLVTLLVLGLGSVWGQNEIIRTVCKPSYERVAEPSGILVVTRNVPTCGFHTKDGSTVFAIKTDGLKLQASDQLEIKRDTEDPRRAIFKPPFNLGLIYSGYREPNIVFNFSDPLSNDTMEIEYIQNNQDLPINGDVNNDFQISPVDMTPLTLSFHKTVPASIHLEVEGAKIKDYALQHMLISNRVQAIVIEFQQNQPVRIRTSPVTQSCSGEFKDTVTNSASHDIQGPVAKAEKSNYKCVNIFHADGDSAHYQVNFKDFIDLVDQDDSLVIDDGSPNTRTEIVKSSAGSYPKRVVEFQGKHLVVIYESPRSVAPSDIQFKLTVRALQSGGVVVKPGELKFPDGGGQVRFELQPESQRFAVVEIAEKTALQNVDLTIYAGTTKLAKFSNTVKLPPVIAANEINTPLVLEFNGKDFSRISKNFKFNSVATSCHKLGTQTSSFSVANQTGPCYWTVGAATKSSLKLDFADLKNSSCLTVHLLTNERSVLKKCNISPTDLFAPLVVNQAYLELMPLTSNSRLSASASTVPADQIIINEAPSAGYFNISSAGYPISYQVRFDDTNLPLKNITKNCVVSPVQVDLRSGEKLAFNKQSIDGQNLRVIGDIWVASDNSTLEVVRSGAVQSSDFFVHRGFQLKATKFDQYVELDLKKNNFTTPEGHRSFYIKVSSPGATGSKFGNRISYNISVDGAKPPTPPQKQRAIGAPTNSYELLLFDSRSIVGRLVHSNYSSSGVTTADTLLIVYRATQANAVLPKLSVAYGVDSSAPNKDDHSCDQFTRSIPSNKLCQGFAYCLDGSDLKLRCQGGPQPQPRIIQSGISGMSTFMLCLLMLALGVFGTLYGPDLYKNAEVRFRSGRYTTFTSTE